MRLDHVLIRTRDLDSMCAFFTDGIGLKVGDRPDFTFPGYWLYAGGLPVIHLRDVGAIEPPTGGPAWPIEHVAFAGDDHGALIARLRASGIAYREQTLPGGAMHQVFARGPEGVLVEVQFPVEAVS